MGNNNNSKTPVLAGSRVLELRAFIRGGEEVTPELQNMFKEALNLVLTYYSKSIKDNKNKIVHHTSIELSGAETSKDLIFLDTLQYNYFKETETSKFIQDEWEKVVAIKNVFPKGLTEEEIDILINTSLR